MECGGRFVLEQKMGLWMPQDFVDLGDLSGEEGATVKFCKWTQVRILSEQRTEFLPGILGLNVWEIAGREFGPAHR